MGKVVVLIVAGPSARALEGLRTARAMHQTGMLEAVRVFLSGPGVRCIDVDDPDAEEVTDEVAALLEAGVPVGACTRSLHETGLLDASARLEGLRPVGVPTQLAAAVAEGWAVISY